MLELTSTRKSILAVRALAKQINDNCGGEFNITILALDFCVTPPELDGRLSPSQIRKSVKRMVEKRDAFYNEGICLDFMTYQ